MPILCCSPSQQQAKGARGRTSPQWHNREQNPEGRTPGRRMAQRGPPSKAGAAETGRDCRQSARSTLWWLRFILAKGIHSLCVPTISGYNAKRDKTAAAARPQLRVVLWSLDGPAAARRGRRALQLQTVCSDFDASVIKTTATALSDEGKCACRGLVTSGQVL